MDFYKNLVVEGIVNIKYSWVEGVGLVEDIMVVVMVLIK